MPASNYAAMQLREQLDRGPYAGEDFYRLQVSGHGQSNHVNVTPDQLRAIIAVLDPEPTPATARIMLEGALAALVSARGNTPATRELVLYELDQATKVIA